MSVHSFNEISTDAAYPSRGTVKLLKSVTSYTWTINNFCGCTNEVIESPVISAGAEGEHCWRIHLYPKGRNDENHEYVAILLFLISCNENKLDVQAEFSIFNNKEKYNERAIKQELLRGKGLGCPDFIKRSFLLEIANGLLPDGHLTIMIEITTGLGPPISPADDHDSVMYEVSLSEQRLSVDMEHLFKSQKYADVTLTSLDQTFKAHKNILAARCSVFDKTFDEKNKNTLEMDDVEPEVLQEMLRFLYTGRADNIGKLANSLLIAAEKYQLEGLKAVCEDALCNSLTVNNAVDRLILADVNKAKRLEARAIRFIITHAKDVIETPGFKSIAESYQLHLLADVFHILAFQNHRIECLQ